jgi:hypothetical protein
MSILNYPKVCVVCQKRQPCHRQGYYCRPCHPVATKARIQAIAAVAKAIRLGALVSAKFLTCTDCGKPARHYDHRDYSKPLSVEPVCQCCNMARGPASYGSFRSAA